jgi:hypothetical protein
MIRRTLAAVTVAALMVIAGPGLAQAAEDEDTCVEVLGMKSC